MVIKINKFKSSILFGILFICYSCDDNYKVRTYKLSKNDKQSLAVSSNVSVNKDGQYLKWEKPFSWEPSEGSSMRLASFLVPYSKGSGDLSVIELSGNGGGILSNVNRWRRQLSLEPTDMKSIENKIEKFVGTIGEFQVIKIIDVNKESSFICAILPAGSKTIFIKLAIRYDGISEVEEDFIKFCTSINFN